jgi:hypothetical protein
MGGLHLSQASQRARDELERRSAQLTAYDFSPGMLSTIYCEDGSVLLMNSAFTEEWKDPESGDEWVFLFCEHYPAMWFDKMSLAFWGSYEKFSHSS